MRSWDLSGRRKRRTREHVIADLSVNHVERLVLRCGWTVQRTAHDYGVDLSMDTYTADGEPESGRVLFQLKATDRLKLTAKGMAIAVRLEWRDVLTWRAEAMPVILVVYDAGVEVGFWLHVQAYFARIRNSAQRQSTITAHIPRQQVVDEAAVRQFGQLRDDVLARIRRALFDEP